MSYRIVIIAAGGKGNRMESDLPKQYMLLNDKPVLMHTIKAFENIADKIIVVVHPDMKSFWKNQCQAYQFDTKHTLIDGGSSRFQSVRNGIMYIKNKLTESTLKETTIAVHDAARPLVEQKYIKQSFEWAENDRGNVLATQSNNSVRIGELDNSQAVNRDLVWSIQTPQTFKAAILSKAFEQEEIPAFTDEASVVEKMGYPIHILKSSQKNIKLTFKEDFEIAQIYLKLNNS